MTVQAVVVRIQTSQERQGQWTEFGQYSSLCNKLSLDSHLLSETQCRHNVCIVHRNNAIFILFWCFSQRQKREKNQLHVRFWFFPMIHYIVNQYIPSLFHILIEKKFVALLKSKKAFTNFREHQISNLQMMTLHVYILKLKPS